MTVRHLVPPDLAKCGAPLTRQCTGPCGRTLVLAADFYRTPLGRDGRQAQCKACMGRYTRRQNEKRAAVMRAGKVVDLPHLEGEARMTYEEIGAELGISKQRVQQIERTAIAKLRALAELEALR